MMKKAAYDLECDENQLDASQIADEMYLLLDVTKKAITFGGKVWWNVDVRVN